MKYHQHHELTLYEKFVRYVWPWILLAAISLGVYWMFLNGLQAIIEISRPVSHYMPPHNH